MNNSEAKTDCPMRLRNIPENVLVTSLLALMTVIFVYGLYCSLHAGLTFDEFFEQKTLSMDIAAVRGLIAGDPDGYDQLLAYRDKYYGIGFHLPVYPLQSVIASVIRPEFGLDDDSAFLLAKHPIVFLTFAGSAMLFYLLLRVFINERWVCLLFSVVYFMYPYLFGHALFNVKDMPFLFVWLLCTWFSLKCAAALMENQRLGFGRFMVLVLLTAWLIAIRIGGLILLGQYLFTFMLVWSERKTDKKVLFTGFLIKTAIFLPLLFALVIIAYPLFWLYPRKIVDAVAYMCHLPWRFHTLTLGRFLSDQDLPGYYIPVWLLVKLPLAIIASLCVMPTVFKDIAQKSKVYPIYLGTFLFTMLFVPMYLAISGVALYNELRQVLFIFPFFLLLGFIVLHYRFPNGSVAVAWAYVGLFGIDHLLLAPYQYAWLNEAARLMDVDKTFETDYWGASSRELSSYITEHPSAYPSSLCVFVDTEHLYLPFLSARCLREAAGGYQGSHAASLSHRGQFAQRPEPLYPL
jgi:hypothetical protein